MEIVSLQAAKTSLSQLIARVEAGEEILLARGKKPVAKLVPLPPKVGTRRFGSMKGTVIVGQEFFDPLPEQEIGPSNS